MRKMVQYSLRTVCFMPGLKGSCFVLAGTCRAPLSSLSGFLCVALPSLHLGSSARWRPTLRGLSRSEAGRRGGEL
jgi:hypothetical protein